MSEQHGVLWAKASLRLGDRVIIENSNLKKFHLLKFDVRSTQWT